MDFSNIPGLNAIDLIMNLWSSGFDVMNLVHKFLNNFVARLSLHALFSFLPPYLVFKFLDYIRRSIFSEDLTGKVVLITGASSGIGEHVAYEYARKGACLVLAARRVNSLREVSEIANILGSPYAIPVAADVSKVEDCKRLIETTVEHFGQLDHLVNCAGITPLGLFEDLIDVDNFAPAMDTNFWGSVYTTYYAIPHLKRSKGKIIQIASSLSWLPAPRLSFYCASKAAVVSFFETLRVELGSEVGVTIVTPGAIESEMTKGKFLMPNGKVKVDQEMRDVQTSVIPIRSVFKCAEAIVDGARRGDRYLTEPSWMKATFLYRVFCPEVLELLNRWFLFPPPGRPATEAPSKILLDLTGLKKYLYPPSVLSPEIKTD